MFGEKKPASLDRFDFTLVAEGENSRMLGYITCREFDSKSLYWQYGGPFPGTKGTSMSFRIYQEALKWSGEKYDRVLTVVENKNTTMLKMHLISGFFIVGFRQHMGEGLVELSKEFKK